MFCENCGEKLEELADLCPSCGEHVEVAEALASDAPSSTSTVAPQHVPTSPSREVFCEECGCRVEAAEQHCPQCGEHMGSEEVFASPVPSARGASVKVSGREPPAAGVVSDAPRGATCAQVSWFRSIVRQMRDLPASQIGTLIVAAATVLLLLVSWKGSGGFFLVVLLPFFAGLVFPLFRPKRLQGWVDRQEEAIARRRALAQSETGTVDRWFRRPYYAGLAGVWRLTARIGDEYLRAGVRITMSLYLALLAVTITFAAIYALVVVVIVLVIVAFMLVVLWFVLRAILGGESTWSWSGARSTRDEGNPFAETKVYKPGFLFDDLVLRVDSEGRVLKPGPLLDESTGYRVKADGVYKEGIVTDEKVAEIDRNGRIKLPGLVSEPTGFRIRDGKILKEGVILDEEIGKIEGDN